MATRKRVRWLEAIEQILEEADQPLHSQEIARRAIQAGIVKTSGKWPEHSVQAAVWRHIREAGNPLGFEMIGGGRRERFYWLTRKGKPKKP